MIKGKKYFVSVAGNIGSGKSSLTKLIAERFDWIPYYESVSDNPYLQDFYKDMKRWSFNLQIYFLAHRFNTHKEILNQKRSVIQDRSIYEDVFIFAKNLHQMGRMDDRDYETYTKLFNEMVSFLKPPDLLVYLKSDLECLIKKIELRGREFEKNIERSYLNNLNVSYEEWIKSYNLGKCLIIESDCIDFVKSNEDFNQIAKLIEDNLD
ncbi:MAG: deoxynucleoside kinase [Ignavibacteria bacterium]|nr:deoxynucleoside kinase [Ignavibacteria bacterium]